MSSIQVNNIKNANGTSAIAIDSSGVATFSKTLVPSSSMMYRNLVINGDMRINQRGGTITVNNASDNYGIDRWQGRGTASDGVFTTVQDTEAPAGFTNSAKITVTTADSSIGTSERYEYRHRVEGNNIANLAWGSSDAKTVTLSFWVRSSVTGTFGGSFTNSAGNRSYVFSYTINSANTWEQKTITVAGDTSGTWLTTNGIGVGVTFSLGHGSDYVEDAGSWYASYEAAVTGQTNLIATINATWYLTGVQLEVGDAATPFEHRSYGAELALCQRYYNRIYDIWGDQSVHVAGGRLMTRVDYPVQMRATPTVTTNTVSNTNCTFQGTTRTNTNGTHLYANSTTAAGDVFFVINNMESNAEL